MNDTNAKGNMKPVLIALSPTLLILFAIGMAAFDYNDSFFVLFMMFTYLIYCPFVSLLGGFQITRNPVIGRAARITRGFGMALCFVILNYIIGFIGCAAVDKVAHH